MALEDRLYPLLKLYEAAPQAVKSLAGRAYRVIPPAVRYGANYARFQSEAAGVETWDAAQIQDYQLKALKQSLRAAAQSPFYAERFAQSGVSVETFESLEQLKSYPLLTKQDLIVHRESMVNPSSLPSQRLYITTGGSSGVPVGFYLQKGVSRPKEQAYLEAQWSRRGYRPGDRVAVIRGGVTSSRAAGNISYYDATRDWLILSSYHLTLERLPDYLAELRAFRPRHLHAYPSAALMLMRGLQQMGAKWDLPLVSVLCGSEKLSGQAQAELEQFFGAPVFHWYGHSERVVLAGQKVGSHALHFWPTYGYVELGEPTANGLREVIGTSFHNEVMPLIRYRTGDYVRIAEAGSARNQAWVVADEVVGRDYEFLTSRTGRRISLTAVNMHDRIFDGLLAVQFYQNVAGEVEVRCQRGPAWSGDLGGIQRGLEMKLGDDFVLTLKLVDEVEKSGAGKHKWLILGEGMKGKESNG